jgi:DNA-binding NarL/FixJ family response regulator
VTLRILVVDDQALVRRGFAMILQHQNDIEVVAEAATGVEAIEAARRHHPDIILMDIRMPEMDGLEATERILAETGERTRIIVLTTFDPDEYIYRALRVGASGFVLKDIPPEELVAAVRTVADGGALLAPSVTRRLIGRFVELPPEQPFLKDGLSNVEQTSVEQELRAHLERLTVRELEVLRALGAGSNNHEIAERLHIGSATVKTHVSSVLAKLGLRDRAQAVVFAYESGVAGSGERR